MSTNKTEHYDLHSWTPEDNFLLSEVNENFAALDAGAVQFLSGSYQGAVAAGVATPQHIQVGVKPRAVFLTTHKSTLPYGGGQYAYTGQAAADLPQGAALVLGEDGFTVQNDGALQFNEKTIQYRYVVLY